MEFKDIKSVAIYGTDCVADISRGDGDITEFISAREKYFDISVDDGVMTVRQKSRNLFYRLILHKIEFKLVLPHSFKGKLRFRNKNGGLFAKDSAFTEAEISTCNGKIDFCNSECSGFSLKMQNGSVTLKNVDISDSASIKCANGTVKIESVNSPSIAISGANATIAAADVTAKKFECSTSNGAIDASGITADDMRLETNNGRINAAPLGDRDDFKLSAETAHGALTVDGVAYKRLSDVAHAAKRLNVKAANGDIDIRFI